MNKYRTGYGFTLIELLLVLALIAIFLSFLPAMQQRGPRYEREQFIERLNGLCRFAWQQTMATHLLHEINFDLKRRVVTVRKHMAGAYDEKRFPKTEPVKRTVHSQLSWPVHIQIKQFILEGFDEVARFGSKDTGEIFFYIMPEGLSQQVTINMVDKKDTIDGKVRKNGLVLNPFTAQFSVYDEFQK